MVDIREYQGIQPELRQLASYDTSIRNKAMSGDLVLILTPATLGSSEVTVLADIAGANAKFERDVVVELKTAAGELHHWFTGTFSVAATKTGAGVVAMGAATVSLVNGVGTCTIEYTGVWAAGDTATVTVTGGTKLGYSITNKTSVDTLVA